MYIFGGRGNEHRLNPTAREFHCPEIHYFDTSTNMWVKPIIRGNKPLGRRTHSACKSKLIVCVID